MTATVPLDLRTELEHGLTLPAPWYSDPAVLELEYERVFHRTWQYAGVAANAAEPGAFFTSQAGLIPVVVVRDRDGAARVVVNRCAHRGVQFCRQPFGNAPEFMCPYHQWTYELSGELVHAPHMGTEFDKSCRNLKPVAFKSIGLLLFGSHC